ncbi:MAG TPA: ABC transporter ATP-binding protein [Candidatus Limnocylindrales bacterium]|jgi:lipopolysaccharide transport system ATP-binding protein
MGDVAISAQGLAKKYRIGTPKGPYGRLTESLWNGLTAPFRPNGEHETATDFWALRDISFEIPRGSAVGIIGRNGAGKSTLLKILSRITEPTLGRAELRGRVGSLLEVGTGFHNELTGRENIFLSGAILGMRRAQITQRFDEIVDFADIGPFLETPVKRYSSGMKVRLGFAVAAFLEPEILFIDEVLAVGDAEFQKKCMGKMSEIGKGGRTILFVSHSMPTILRLCDRAILLDHGRLVTDGSTRHVVRSYLESDLGRTAERHWDDPRHAPGDDVARLKSIRVLPADGGPAEEVDIRQPIDVEVEYWCEEPGELRPSVGLHFYNDDGIRLFASHDWNDREAWGRPRVPGVVRSTCRVPGNFLAEGRIVVTVRVATLAPLVNHAVERDAVAFQVVDRSDGDGVRGHYANDWPGVVRPMLEWHIEIPLAASDRGPSRLAATNLGHE